jgi:hypothetical protein
MRLCLLATSVMLLVVTAIETFVICPQHIALVTVSFRQSWKDGWESKRRVGQEVERGRDGDGEEVEEGHKRGGRKLGGR